MKSKIKKVFAREGLFLLFFLLLGIILYFIADFLVNYTTPEIITDAEMRMVDEGRIPQVIKWWHFWYSIKILSFFIIFGIGYLIRFIIWALRTLK